MVNPPYLTSSGRTLSAVQTARPWKCKRMPVSNHARLVTVLCMTNEHPLLGRFSAENSYFLQHRALLVHMPSPQAVVPTAISSHASTAKEVAKSSTASRLVFAGAIDDGSQTAKMHRAFVDQLVEQCRWTHVYIVHR